MAEIAVGLGILTAVGVACYSMLLSATILFAKNVTVNTSGTILRTTLDRMYLDVNQAYGIPKLINADGSLVGDNPPASGVAGFYFEQYLGGPYVVTNPSNSGLTSSTTSITLKSSTDALTGAPTPSANDVVILDNGVTRPVVNNCSSSVSNGVATATITLRSPLGAAVVWDSTTTKTAFLVHKKAYVVATVNGYGELRLYNNAETVTDYNNPTNYTVVSRELSGVAPENTPFNLVTQNGNQFLKINLRMEDQKFNKTLAIKQAKEFNTFMQLETMLRPRN